MKKLTLILLIATLIGTNYGVDAKQSFIGSGQKPVCVSNGDYCKDNTDCCSKNCTSNRCMISNVMAVNTNEVNIAPTTQQPAIALDDRFNPEEEKNCQRKGSKCSASQNCCKFLTCEKKVCRDKSFYVNGTETLGYQENGGLANRFNDDESSSVRPAVSGKCGDVGDKCFNPSDCCTPLKCHSFLHQCVT